MPMIVHCRQYRVSRLAVQVAKGRMAELADDVNSTTDTVWDILAKRSEEKGKCKCGTTISSVRDHETVRVCATVDIFFA